VIFVGVLGHPEAKANQLLLVQKEEHPALYVPHI
jgi:hypothetical protein